MWIVKWSEAGLELFAVRRTWRDAMDIGLAKANTWGCRARIVHETRWRQ